jgi:hypothetical protein
MKENIAIFIISTLVIIWVYSLFKSGRDEPLDINARDRYKNGEK